MLPPTKHKVIIINNRCNYEVTIADFPAGWTDMSSFEIPDHGHGDMGLLFSELGVVLRRSISEAGIQRIFNSTEYVRSTGDLPARSRFSRTGVVDRQMHERKVAEWCRFYAMLCIQESAQACYFSIPYIN